MSPLPQRRCLRRPVREMRTRPFAHRAHQSEEYHQRFAACAEGDQELVSAAERLPGMAEAVDSGRSQGMAPECVRPVQELARHGLAAPRHDARPGLGHPRSRGGSRGQGALCVVRCAHRLYFEYKGALREQSRALGYLAAVVAGRGNPSGALHRQGQHRCTSSARTTSCSIASSSP